MKIFFIGEIYYSALCLDSILSHNIKVHTVITTQYKFSLLKRFLQLCDSELIKIKGYHHSYYWTRYQRFLKNLVKKYNKNIRKKHNKIKMNVIEHFYNDLLNILNNEKPDLVIVAGLSKKIPKSFLKIPKYGFINCHPSLLPKYRGPSPEFYIIKNNEEYTGMTIHRLDEDWDSGEILEQKKIRVNKNDCIGDLEKKETRLVGELIENILDDIENIRGKKQDNTIMSYHHGFKLKELKINWSLSSEDIYNLIRSRPEGYAFTFYKGEKVYLINSIISKKQPRVNNGTIFKIENNKLYVKCGKGSIIIDKLIYGKGLKKYFISPKIKEFEIFDDN